MLIPILDTPEIWLRTAIRTAAAQSYPNIDVILSDNGSRASTIEVLKQAKERWPDRIILTQENEKKGTAYALDAALRAADKDTAWFSKLDSDDIAFSGLEKCPCKGSGMHRHPGREEARVELFGKLPESVALVYDNYMQLVYEPRPHLIPIILRPYDYRALLEGNYIHGNSIWRSSVFERWGGPLKETFVYDGYEGKANRHGEDYNLWLNITDFADGFWMNVDPAFTWTYRSYQGSKYMSDRKGVDYCRAFLQNRARERRGLL